MLSPDIAKPVLQLFEKRAQQIFGTRLISLFKFGSLGTRGGFSLCSDVDGALMLDHIETDDAIKIASLSDEIKASNLDYADRFSLFWSSYHDHDFSQGRGRFAALDRLDFLQHAILIAGVDRRAELIAPHHNDLIIESAEFILSYMLTEEKMQQLMNDPELILKKGARYFSKFVLFPVRLLFTLDNPNVISSNQKAVQYFNDHLSKQLPDDVSKLVGIAYELRNMQADTVVNLDILFVKRVLHILYVYCINQYYEALSALKAYDLKDQLHHKMMSLQS